MSLVCKKCGAMEGSIPIGDQLKCKHLAWIESVSGMSAEQYLAHRRADAQHAKELAKELGMVLKGFGICPTCQGTGTVKES